MFFVSVSELVGGAVLQTIAVTLPGFAGAQRFLSPVQGATVHVYERGTSVLVPTYSDQHGIAPASAQPLTTDADGQVVDVGNRLVFVAQPAELDVKIEATGITTRIVPVGQRSDPKVGLTDEELLAWVMNLMPVSRQVDPAYLGVFTDGMDPAFTLDPSNAISRALVAWPDGGRGTLQAVAITPPQPGSANPSVVDEYTVTYRPRVDTSGSDIPGSLDVPSMGWVPWTDGQAGRPAFVPLSDQAAAQRVTRTPEIRPQHQAAFARNPGSMPRNFYIPSDTELAQYAIDRVVASSVAAHTDNVYLQYVTGRAALYIDRPSTDELIQWASHKWGVPTDRVRAQMHLESMWQMDMLSDLLNCSSAGHPEWYADYPAPYQIPGGVSVWATTGISQCHWFPDGSSAPGSEPLRWRSTAFALDYYLAWVRFHLDNPQGHRVNWGDASYVPGDYEACQGGWFLPFPWRTAALKTVGDSTNGFLLQAIGDYGAWAVTIHANAGTPANKDIILTRNGVVMVTISDVVATLAAAYAALNALPFNGHALAASPWGDQSAALPDMAAVVMDVGGTMMNYVKGVEDRFVSQPWLVADFSNAPDVVQQWRQPRVSRSSGGVVSARPLPARETFVASGPPVGPAPAPVLFAGDQMVVLVWQPLAPADTGGAPTQTWQIVEYDQGWVSEQFAASTFFRFGGIGLGSPLPNASALRFAVAAQNRWGIGPWSAPSSSATPTAGLPDQPTGVQTSADLINGRINLSWVAPARVATDPITDWIVIPVDPAGVMQTPIDVGSTVPSASILLGPGTGLDYQKAYTFMVRAVNDIGAGPPSQPSLPISTDQLVPPSRPRTAPAHAYLYPADGGALLIWTATVDNGGEPLTSWFLWEPDGFWSQTQGFPASDSFRFTGLSNGQAVRFAVAAVNALGQGPQSLPSNLAMPTLGLPEQPQTVAGSVPAGAGEVDLTWAPPVDAPASPITGYKVLPIIAGVPQAEVDSPGTGTALNVTGLTSGQPYTFRVRAVNAVGEGPPSDESAAYTPH